MSHTESTTTDYKKFRFLIDNRDTSRKHINKLKDAIRSNPEILEVQPILVNENMEIIDGQHRFTAASELGLPIHYTQVKGLDMNTARSMNVLQRKWTFDDYVRSFAKAGNLNYKAFMVYQHDYPLIRNNALIVYLVGYQQHGILVKFRRGDFVIEQDQEDIEELLTKASKIAETIVIPFSQPLAMALLMCIKNDDFDYDRFLAKLEENPKAIQRGGVKKDYLRQIEDVYNRNAKIVVRLF